MMNSETDLFNKLSFFIDEQKRKIQLGLYAVALVGIGCSIYAVRPFNKFRYAKDIPDEFIIRRYKFRGQVLNLEIGPPLLLRIDHKPLFLASWRKKAEGLPVELASINIFPPGISWLNTLVVGKDVEFVPFRKYNEYVTCAVIYEKQSISEQLINLGLASVQPYDYDLQCDRLYNKYYSRLLKLENKAELNKLGMWDDGKFSIRLFVKERVSKLIYSLAKLFRKK